MKTTRRFCAILAVTTLMVVWLSGCGSITKETETTPAAKESKIEPAKRTFTDSKGHTVEIPTQAKKVIYTGSDLGDLLALGVKPAGAALGVIAKQVAYPDLLTGIEDIGDVEANLEKVIFLEPDLILMDSGGTYYKESDYDDLKKIAPTVTYDRLPTFERLLVMGDILGKNKKQRQRILCNGK